MENNSTPSNNRNLGERVVSALKKDYALIGQTHIRGWHIWLGIGLVVGITTGIILVANRSGKIEPGRVRDQVRAPMNPTGESFFPLGLYCAEDFYPRNPNDPPDKLTVIDDFPRIAQAGFNVVQSYRFETYDPAHGSTDEKAKEFLDAAQANGIKVAMGFPEWNSDAEIQTVVLKRVRLLKDHPALYGWNIADEPGPCDTQADPGCVQYQQYVELLQRAYQAIKIEDPKHPVLLTGSPGWIADPKYPYHLSADIIWEEHYGLPEIADAEQDGQWGGWMRFQDVISDSRKVFKKLAPLGKSFIATSFSYQPNNDPLAYGGTPLELGNRYPSKEELRYLVYGPIIGGASPGLFFVCYRFHYANPIGEHVGRIEHVDSSDGATLRFTVPETDDPFIAYYGHWWVQVENENGISPRKNFEIGRPTEDTTGSQDSRARQLNLFSAVNTSAPPTINAITPSSAFNGDGVTIRGSGFAPTDNTILFILDAGDDTSFRGDEAQALDHAQGGHGNGSTAQWEIMSSIAQELKALAPVLTAPASKISIAVNPATIEFLAKEYAGRTYIIAANPSPASQTATFTIPQRSITSVSVYAENHSLVPATDSFTDTFAPYEVHVYEVALGS